MCPILSYQNIATLTPVYLQGNWTLKNSVRFVKTMTNIMNGDYILRIWPFILVRLMIDFRDYALVLDYMYICFIHINIMC